MSEIFVFFWAGKEMFALGPNHSLGSGHVPIPGGSFPQDHAGKAGHGVKSARLVEQGN